MEFAAQLPVNGLSFGQVSLSILKEFHKRGLEPCLFPINEDISSFSFDKDFVDWLKACIKKSPQKHKRDNRCIMLWHLNATALTNVSNKSVLLSFYELDSPTPSEINIASNFSKIAFTSKDSIKTFSDYGISAEHVPLGFDSNHFKTLDKKYYDDGRIVFNLCGKLEKRKRHNKERCLRQTRLQQTTSLRWKHCVDYWWKNGNGARSGNFWNGTATSKHSWNVRNAVQLPSWGWFIVAQRKNVWKITIEIECQ